MSGNYYFVMRSDGAGFETVGPKATAFAGFDDADKYARKMLDQHTGHLFVVCRAVASYKVEQVKSVKLLADDSRENEATAGNAKNVLELPSRKAMQRYRQFDPEHYSENLSPDQLPTLTPV